MVKVAVLGYGTVGSGVVGVLDENAAEVAKSAGDAVEVKYILDLREFPGDKHEAQVVHDINIILDDPEIQVICETMGGLEPAFTFEKNALMKGKSVCTSNKELVAAHGPELVALAKKNNCSYMFEASVGGGIPIIRPLNTSLAPENIEKIKGILNGTTNYILSKMASEDVSFETVLKEAQEKGYAEKNPKADVEGIDACRKIAILASLMTGKNVDSAAIHTEGITDITTEDFQYAKKMGKSIKLLAMCTQSADGIGAMVAPFMIGAGHPLNGVNGVFNAVYVTGNMLGDVMFYGQGAGKLATASAVVSDVMECAQTLGSTVAFSWSKEAAVLQDYQEAKYSFFVRVPVLERGSVMNSFEIIKEISIKDDEFGFITKPMTEKELQDRKKGIRQIIHVIRIEE